MGNQNDRNVANVVFSVPIVGPALRVSTAIATLDSSQLNFDIAGLNPLRAISDLKRQIEMADSNFYEGIRFGKRALGISPVGLTLGPGADLFHYAIVIDGTLYQVKAKQRKSSFYINITEDEKEIKSFQWVQAGYLNRKSKQDLKEFCENYSNSKSYAIIPENNHETNCQIFVGDLYSFASNLTLDESIKDIISCCGHIFV